MLSEIKDRRSIRKYKKLPVPVHMIEEIIQAGILAPSARNRQPWRFIVVSDEAKEEMVAVMRKGLEREKREPLLPDDVPLLGGVENSIRIMEQAPVVIMVENPLGTDLRDSLDTSEHVDEICNAQSVGAAIENMILTATNLGLGSLWICDIFHMYRELCDWLGCSGELFAAVAIGYADEAPASRPRKTMDMVVEWKSKPNE
ncbi:MAG: nitroreductase family protein [Lachnospiraceae bacterium]|nr:nitroreductase family protein [Lachnospiraceae bacterium]